MAKTGFSRRFPRFYRLHAAQGGVDLALRGILAQVLSLVASSGRFLTVLSTTMVRQFAPRCGA
jgi:hypothetical protein